MAESRQRSRQVMTKRGGKVPAGWEFLLTVTLGAVRCNAYGLGVSGSLGSFGSSKSAVLPAQCC